jgi:hypothetical protein
MAKRLTRGGLTAIGIGVLTAMGAFGWMVGSNVQGPKPAPSPSASVAPVPTPSAPPVDQIAAAQAAAFPEGLTGQTESGSRIDYQPGILVDAPFGPVLVNEGRISDAAHVDAGTVAVHYLRRAGSGFAVARAFPEAVVSGSNGAMAEMAVSDKFSDLPVIYAQGGGTWQGYTCSWTTLTELRPDGPAELVRFMDGYSNAGAVEGGAESSEGKIADIVPGRSFTVRFTGTRAFTATYVRRGGKYVRESGEEQTGC